MMRPKIDWQLWVALVFCCIIGRATSLHAGEPGVIEKARAEGELVLYTAWGLDTVQALQKAFAKKYPFIKVDVLRTGSERLLNITIAEHKQKLFRADVFSGSHLAMINHTRAGHLQKYVSAEQRAFPKEYKDPDGYWTAFYMDTRVLAYNTKMAVREELPKSYVPIAIPIALRLCGVSRLDHLLRRLRSLSGFQICSRRVEHRLDSLFSTAHGLRIRRRGIVPSAHAAQT
jgi:hypothetical protein